MEQILRGRGTLLFTIGLALLVCATSIGGLTLNSLYARETPAWLVQCIGQDIIDLAVLVPTLVVSMLCMRRGMRPALFVWLGATVYTAYTFVIYCFSVHFNQFFLVYCATLGLSVFATITTIAKIDLTTLTGSFDLKRSVRAASGFLFMLALLFSLVWLKEILPAALRNEVPLSLSEVGLPTNAVHVLDLSVVLPAFILVSVLLWKKHPYGYLLVPIFLAFAVLMEITIGGLMVVMLLKGLPSGIPLIAAFGILAALSALMFAGLFRRAAG